METSHLLAEERRKPPSHDSRCEFYTVLRRSVHGAVIRTKIMPSPGTHQPPPDDPASFRYLHSLVPGRMPATLSLTLWYPAQHSSRTSPAFFLGQQKRAFSGPS
jgi:hypothetical protein